MCEKLTASDIWLLSSPQLVWPEKPWFIPKAITNWQEEWENPDLCPQNVFPSCPNVSFLPGFISPFCFPLANIDFNAKIIKHKYFSSALWKEPCHWSDSFCDGKNPAADGIFSPFGTHLVPTVTVVREDYFDVFPPLSRMKYAPAVFVANIIQMYSAIWRTAVRSLQLNNCDPLIYSVCITRHPIISHLFFNGGCRRLQMSKIPNYYFINSPILIFVCANYKLKAFAYMWGVCIPCLWVASCCDSDVQINHL